MEWFASERYISGSYVSWSRWADKILKRLKNEGMEVEVEQVG